MATKLFAVFSDERLLDAHCAEKCSDLSSVCGSLLKSFHSYHSNGIFHLVFFASHLIPNSISSRDGVIEFALQIAVHSVIAFHSNSICLVEATINLIKFPARLSIPKLHFIQSKQINLEAISSDDSNGFLLTERRMIHFSLQTKGREMRAKDFSNHCLQQLK